MQVRSDSYKRSLKLKVRGILTIYNDSRERNESETFKLITDLERNAKRLIEGNTKERIENEKKIAYALGHQVD